VTEPFELVHQAAGMGFGVAANVPVRAEAPSIEWTVSTFPFPIMGAPG
jgi:hypothetical protein